MNDTASYPLCLSCGAERMAGQAHYCNNIDNEPIITNLKCWNCDQSISPTQSEYEKDDYRCPGCDKIQMNKTIDNGNVNLPNCPCGSDEFEFRSTKEKEFDTKITFVYVCKKCGNIYQKMDNEFWLLEEGINKTESASPERSEGRVPPPRTKYEEYLASYHGAMPPLSYEKWKLINLGFYEFKCPNCKYNQFDSELNSHIYICRACGSTFKEEPPGQFIHLSSINPLSKDRTRISNPKDQIGITKLPLHLIPPPALARLSKVMELGAKKYGAYNWRETEVNLTVYLTAALRHIYSILDGEDIDTESGQHHAAHAMACCAIILDAIELNKLLDDRPTPGNFAHLVTTLQEKK